MAKKNFKAIEDLNKYILEQVESVLENEVSEEIKDMQSIAVQNVVYDAYESQSESEYKYVRRGEEGGLADTDNMHNYVTELPRGRQLIIINNTLSEDGKFKIAPLVEHGHDNGYGKYQYPFTAAGNEDDFLQPRPFQKKTIEYFNTTKEHIDVFKDGLRLRGIKVK